MTDTELESKARAAYGIDSNVWPTHEAHNSLNTASKIEGYMDGYKQAMVDVKANTIGNQLDLSVLEKKLDVALWEDDSPNESHT